MTASNAATQKSHTTVHKDLSSARLIEESLRRGEGVFGMTYSINGPAAQPRVGVNPVSALTPGILRRIFEPLTPRDTGGGHSFTPDAPPEVEAPPPVPTLPQSASSGRMMAQGNRRRQHGWLGHAPFGVGESAVRCLGRYLVGTRVCEA